MIDTYHHFCEDDDDDDALMMRDANMMCENGRYTCTHHSQLKFLRAKSIDAIPIIIY
jgi:hypothetical protein